ncbi:MAG: NAD(P)/FAD-dependent oxidoreductase [Candidatus Micrarchaeota archaeon]|nr:NAD(P)/FAD-dependent oxidoreductase [Candidatus Micrarchaeota archaeon]
MERKDYDVIIVGAGPAGSTLARICAQGGLDVAVFDKRKAIGNPVRCGEGLGSREVIEQGLEVPRWAISTDVKGAKVVAPNGKELIWESKETSGWILERKLFDSWLAQLAVAKGAEIHVNNRVIDVIRENGKLKGVKVKNGACPDICDYTAKIIVSAEGMESLTARKMGFPTVHRLYDVDTCYQYEMQPYNHQNLIELYFGNKIAPRGYVWIFPKANKRANVGIGIGAHLETQLKKSNIKGADPKPYLDEFVKNNKELKEASTLMDFGGVISVCEPIGKFTMDNAMVIGTAAKQVDPIHGGGIALAMESGALAGNAILEAKKNSNFTEGFLFNAYEKPWRETAGSKMAKRLLLRKVMEKLDDDDLNYIFSNMNQEDLAEIVGKSKFAETAARMVAGRPQLLKVLGALMG